MSQSSPEYRGRGSNSSSWEQVGRLGDFGGESAIPQGDNRFCPADDPDATGVIPRHLVMQYLQSIRQYNPNMNHVAQDSAPRPELEDDYFESLLGEVEHGSEPSKAARHTTKNHAKQRPTKERVKRRRFVRAKAAIALGILASPYTFSAFQQADLTPNFSEVAQDLPESMKKINAYHDQYGIVDPGAAVALYSNFVLRAKAGGVSDE